MKIKDLYEDTVNEAGLKSLLKRLAPSEATQQKLSVAALLGGISIINGAGADIQDRNNKRFADHTIKKEKEKSGYPGSKPIAKDPRKDAYGSLGEGRNFPKAEKDWGDYPEFSELRWWPLGDGDYPVRDIAQAIGATHYADWGKVGVPWSNQMIGGGGSYLLRGDFGYLLTDAAVDYKNSKPYTLGLGQISFSERGTGLGTKYMELLKQYADSKKLSLTVYKVTNKSFFNKFDWLQSNEYGDTYIYKQSNINESGVGRIVNGVNTTVDVGPGEIRKQAAKFGNIVSNDGVPNNIKKSHKR